MNIKAIDWRAIFLAIFGLIAPFVYVEIIGWSPDFPFTEGSFGEFFQWAGGWLLTLLGIGAAGAASFRINLQRKIKKAHGGSIVLGLRNIREV